LDLLRLFAYGTFQDYKRASSSLPSLSEFETTKLKQLTIVSLAAQSKTLHYATLMKELEMRLFHHHIFFMTAQPHHIKHRHAILKESLFILGKSTWRKLALLALCEVWKI